MVLQAMKKSFDSLLRSFERIALALLICAGIFGVAVLFDIVFRFDWGLQTLDLIRAIGFALFVLLLRGFGRFILRHER